MKNHLWYKERRNVVLAFWATVLIGVPCWYHTTQVSRASLPIIPEFSALQPTIPVALQGVSSFSAHKLVTGLNLLQNTHHFTNVSSDAATYTIDWHEGDEFYTRVEPGERVWKIVSTELQSQNLEESMMAYMLKIFEDERTRIASIISKNYAPDLRVVKYNAAYEVVLSLMYGSTDSPVRFPHVQRLLEYTFLPIMTQLADVADFSLESQFQHHADLTFVPQFDEESQAFVLQTTDLKNFINSAEWNLASAHSDGKPLNFVIYVPEPRYRPLLIKDHEHLVPTNSFLLPQFGAVLIYNPDIDDDTDTNGVPPAVFASLLQTCSMHLLTLLGMPRIPDALGDTTLWRIDGLIRQRLIETILSAQETLVSITKIVKQIPNMHVPTHVATRIQGALIDLAEAKTFMQAGKITEALRRSRSAVQQAEKAFFDEKMVSLLYFPDEHKYGVYMPLFGPLLLPLLMAGFRELKLFAQSRKLRQKPQGKLRAS